MHPARKGEMVISQQDFKRQSHQTEDTEAADLRAREALRRWRGAARNIAAVFFVTTLIEALALLFVFYWLRHGR